MLTDPQTITIDGASISLPRIASEGMESIYQDGTGATRFRVSHTTNGRERSLLRLDLSKIGEDPFQAQLSRSYAASVYMVVDRPLNGVGFTDTEILNATTGFLAKLSVAGFMAKIVGLES